MAAINERLDKLFYLLTSHKLKENQGLGNEINFHIFDYPPQDELVVREHINFLKHKINGESWGINIKEFDLYEIMLGILESKGYLKKVFDMEREKGTEGLINPIKSTLRITLKNDLIVEYIKNGVDDSDIVFLTGVGKVWPIIRSHIILSNLHPVLSHLPLIMFYPGTYVEGNLHLFDEISDNNYYRAFRLVEW